MKIEKTTNILACIGISISIILFIMKTGNLPCGSENCGEVINSKYGSILGIPISLFSIILWTFILTNVEYKKINKKIYSVCLLVGSIVFILIQKFVIYKFCIFCVTHAIISIIYSLTILRSKKSIKHNSNYGLYGLIIASIFISIYSKEKSYTITLPPEKEEKIIDNSTNTINKKEKQEIDNFLKDIKLNNSPKDKEKIIKSTDLISNESTQIKKNKKTAIKSNKSNINFIYKISEDNNNENFDFQGLKWQNQNLVSATKSTIRAYSLSCSRCRVELIKNIENIKNTEPYVIKTSKAKEDLMVRIYAISQTKKEFNNYLLKLLKQYKNVYKTPTEEVYEIIGFQSILPNRENDAKIKVKQQQNMIKKLKIKKFPSNIKLSK